MSRGRTLCGLWSLVALLVIGGDAAFGGVSGRLELVLIARRVPTTLTGEIKLETPSEFTLLEFAIALKLALKASFGFADLNLDAAVNTAGSEHCVIKVPIYLGDLSFGGIRFDKLNLVPEVWLAVPFEGVTDVNNLPNGALLT